MSDDPFVGRLEEAVESARLQSEWKDDYMLLEMKYQEVRDEGRELGRAEGIESLMTELRAQGMDEAAIELAARAARERLRDVRPA